MHYWKGDKIEYTGKTEYLYGELFYEFVFLEGHKKGQTGVTEKSPPLP